MKIVQLISGLLHHVTNEERDFIKKHSGSVRIDSLNEHEQWIAQNLLRKGVYAISKNDNILIKNLK